jgi:hypothetical protein
MDIPEQRHGQILPRFVDDRRDGFSAKPCGLGRKLFIPELQQLRIGETIHDLLPKREIDKQAMEIEDCRMRRTEKRQET